MVITAPYSKNMDKSICQSKQRAEYKTRYTFAGKHPRAAEAFDFIGCTIAMFVLIVGVALLTIIIISRFRISN